LLDPVDESIDFINMDHGRSLLAKTFNDMWCHCLNMRDEGHGITHFAMLHSDLWAQRLWARILHDELAATDADLCAAVVPIKDGDGLSSTAVSADDPFHRRRLTIKEVNRLPVTFDAEACGYPGRTLLANTGCWICRLDKLWVDDVIFTIRDKIVRNDEGKREALVEPEDWHFSRQIFERGGKIVCTRKVQVRHYGSAAYTMDRTTGRDIDHMADGPLPTLKDTAPNCAAPLASPVQSSEEMLSECWELLEKVAHDTRTPACDFARSLLNKQTRQLKEELAVSRRENINVPTNGFHFPDDVDGWLTVAEGKALAQLAAGKRVLEIGSYCGRSTICLARTAKRVLAIDPHDGRGTPKPRDTSKDFFDNLQRYGVADKVDWSSYLYAPYAFEGTFDLIFIDGAHSLASVRRDIKQTLPLLAEGGLLAFHDYRLHAGEIDGRWDPGVTEAVNELLSKGAKLISRHDTIAVVAP